MRTVRHLAISMLLIYSAIFVALAVLPTDPARALLGPMASESAVAELRRQYGMDRAFPVRYLRTLGQMAVGNFGVSVFHHRPALDVVSDLAPATFARAGASLLVGIAVGLIAGAMIGLCGLPRLAYILACLVAVPSFCIMILILWWGSAAGLTPLRNPAIFEILAIAGSSIYCAGAIGRQVADRLDLRHRRPMHVDFLMLLHADRQEIVRIIFREALPEAIAISLNSIPAVLTGITFAELIFGLSGFGSAFIHAALRGDGALVIAGSLILGFVLLLIQRFGELVTKFFDPRSMRSD